MYRMILMLLTVAVVLVTSVAEAARPTARRMRLGQSATMSDEIQVAMPSGKPYTPGVVKSGDWTWSTTVTTNENNSITVISEGTHKTKPPKTLCVVWHDQVVPVKLRSKFLTLTDEQKSMALAGMSATADAPVTPQYPVKKVDFDSVTDNNITQEIHEIEIREEIN